MSSLHKSWVQNFVVDSYYFHLYLHQDLLLVKVQRTIAFVLRYYHNFAFDCLAFSKIMKYSELFEDLFPFSPDFQWDFSSFHYLAVVARSSPCF